MRSYIVKFFFVLAFVLLFYFLGIQGCANQFYGGLGTVTCEDFPERFGCSLEREVDPPSDEEEPDQDERRDKNKDKNKDKDKDKDKGRDRPLREKEPKPPRTKPTEPRKSYLNFEYVVPSGKVDIIFVIDNSSSMAKEHRNLSGQFVSFLHNLKHVDYHIAIITTDISSSPRNPVRGKYYQDGKFIPIGPKGQRRRFLKNENRGQRIPQRIVQDFQRAIERPETKRCDQENQPRSSRRNKYDFDDEESAIG